MLTKRLHDVLAKARQPHLYRRDSAAIAVWAAVYSRLTADKPGITGAITARGDAHALRLQVLYAVLAGSDTIRPEHVFAALEVVRYAHDSASYIFGDKTGNKDADRILQILRTEGLKTRTELYLQFSGNIKADRLQAALDLLLEHGYAQREERAPKESSFKPVEVWWAIG